ncbi:hypothetical protein C7S18_21810 [Ahniella affigens]|uniref:Uncharacterized protein n=2 Tax=Ahniella affigens TaxID=2021234 RepID=A0A2P1PXT2_9GAMM|nr:hypothetical protein C7S18_21810 [Ahniella affigens]
MQGHALDVAMPTDLPVRPKPKIDRMRRGCVGVVVVGGVLTLIVLAIVASVIWQDGGVFFKRTESAIQDGRSFGQERLDQACLDETKARLKKTTGFADGMPLLGFFRGCTMVAKPTGPFCEGVPMPLELFDSAAYQQQQCDALELGKHPACKPVFNEVQQLCYRRWLEQEFKE